jgi:hypothetical protein
LSARSLWQTNYSLGPIVQFHTPPTNDDLKQLGTFGQVKKNFGSIKAVNASVPSNSLAALENNPNVRYISPAVGASLARQYGWDEAGVGVAIIDSGIAPKLDDLTGSNGLTRVLYSESFVAVKDIPGRCDRSVALSKHRAVAAVVAGGYDYHYSRFPCGFHSLAERIEGVALEQDAPATG